MIIIPFLPQYQKDFERLNKEWITKYFEIETEDQEVFSDIKKYILDKNGMIYFAIEREEVIGTVAVYQVNKSLYEIGKMAVTTDQQNKGIGRLLMQCAIDFAKSKGASEIELYTSSKLISAIKLYEKLGFRQELLTDTRFKRADVKMLLKV